MLAIEGVRGNCVSTAKAFRMEFRASTCLDSILEHRSFQPKNFQQLLIVIEHHYLMGLESYAWKRDQRIVEFLILEVRKGLQSPLLIRSIALPVDQAETEMVSMKNCKG